MSVVKDRRSSLRVEVEGRARIHTDRDAFDGRCVDLGLDGIAIRSARAARPGEQVTLEAQVDGQRLRLEATLVRRQRAGGEYHLGLAFVEVDLDTQRRIEHLLFERLARSPQGDFMRAFVAHADRVPPPALREGAHERTHDRTMVAGTLTVPVISGHTQVVAVDYLPMVDRTVIAPPPPRSETVIADARLAHAPPPVVAAPGVPDEAWLDDEMDTAQFRLLEAAQASEAGELEADDEELSLLEPEEAEPEHTVVVGGFAPPPPRERTLVTGDALERPLRERTLVTGGGAPELVALAHTTTLPVSLDLEPSAERVPEVPAERTLPFLRDLLPRSSSAAPPVPPLAAAERTAVIGSRAADDAESRPTLRALLDATALLRRPESEPRRRGPRVIVSVPHRTYRRDASTPWNQR